MTSSPTDNYMIHTQSDEEELNISDNDDSPGLPNSKVKPISFEDLNNYTDYEVI